MADSKRLSRWKRRARESGKCDGKVVDSVQVVVTKRFGEDVGEALIPANEVVEWAGDFLQEFRKSSAPVQPRLVSDRPVPKWLAPPQGMFKINTDAALNVQGNSAGIGVVIRNFRGQVMLSSCKNFRTAFSPVIAEALAVLEGLRLAKLGGFFPTVLESDALTVVQDICRNESLSSDVGLVIDDILFFCRDFNFFSFRHVPRLANKVAHGLAKLALSNLGEFVWSGDCPLCVENLVMGDFPQTM
ncbi:hypothetical protein EZV62_026488 [Acer yangbiense]|uniref:RNase H type-1 domain-containing protein n=1 Tax=Acer yangbiense TaxID=1000413 RepID=A0A5C7GQX3_9ROSI|nr:hypothetical protein EZV62_026488 [Acer yangbiense]